MANFLKKAFRDMKESAKAQHEVDKAEFQAAKAEAKANFEENRGHNTFAKAKADAKKSWDDAHMTPAERATKMQEERDAQIADATDTSASRAHRGSVRFSQTTSDAPDNRRSSYRRWFSSRSQSGHSACPAVRDPDLRGMPGGEQTSADGQTRRTLCYRDCWADSS